jgi:large conductance mechanosensitive channel
MTSIGGAVKGECCHFMNFISRGNMLDLAVGTVLGGLFGKIVTSFVEDIIGPFLLLVSTHTLENSFYTLKNGPNAPYNSFEEAKKDKALVVNWGPFAQIALNFFIQGLCLYFFVRMVDQAKKVPTALLSST